MENKKLVLLTKELKKVELSQDPWLEDIIFFGIPNAKALKQLIEYAEEQGIEVPTQTGYWIWDEDNRKYCTTYHKIMENKEEQARLKEEFDFLLLAEKELISK